MNDRIGLCFTLVVLLAASNAWARCDIRLLEGNWDRTELPLLDMTDYIANPGEQQRKIVREALDYFSPLMCHSATRVVFLDDDGESGGTMAWVDGDYPDLLNIAATSSKASEMNLSQRGVAPAYRAGVVDTLVHEAAHTAENLLQHVATGLGESASKQIGDAIFDSYKWDDAAIEKARQIVQHNLLDQGFSREWAQLHQRSVDFGLAKPYHGAGDKSMSEAAILKMGVASGYGGDEAAEDIAEMASGILAAKAYSDYGASAQIPPTNLICQKMRAEPGPGIPDKLATIFAKVGFLHSVEIIDDLHYDWCVGNLKVQAPGNGFFTLRSGQRRNDYTSDAGGTIGTSSDDGSWVFKMWAGGSITIDGDPAPARIELIIRLAPAGAPRPSFPRGIYPIGNKGNKLNVYYTKDGEKKMGISVSEGVALIARASTQLVEGSVFVLRAVNWTELMPLPTPPSEPTVITFRKKN